MSEEQRLRILVGLGNPGPRYEATRHNIGFRLLDRLAPALGIVGETEGANYRVAWGRAGSGRIALLKPMTYMNRSGEALARFPEGAGVSPEDHLVILDDVSLPFGTLRFRRGGSDGGHRGLSSVLAHLGSLEVPRLRLGVGRGDDENDLADFVLSPFTAAEEQEIEPWLDRAVDGVRVFLAEGTDAAMNRFNG